MGIHPFEFYFKGRAPELSRIVDKVQEISGIIREADRPLDKSDRSEKSSGLDVEVALLWDRIQPTTVQAVDAALRDWRRSTSEDADDEADNDADMPLTLEDIIEELFTKS